METKIYISHTLHTGKLVINTTVVQSKMELHKTDTQIPLKDIFATISMLSDVKTTFITYFFYIHNLFLLQKIKFDKFLSNHTTMLVDSLLTFPQAKMIVIQVEKP